MNARGVESLLHSKVKLGGDASIAAGPKGRTATAETDAFMRSELLSYSRARGVFAGVSLEGSTLRPDEDANHRLYGNDLNAQQIIIEPRHDCTSIGKNTGIQTAEGEPATETVIIVRIKETTKRKYRTGQNLSASSFFDTRLCGFSKQNTRKHVFCILAGHYMN